MASVWVAGAAAGLVAIGATVAVERLGGRIGGLLGTLPTTIVPAAAGIWAATGEPAAFSDAMGAVPVGMWVNVLFLQVWQIGPRWLPPGSLSVRLGAMVGLSLVVWAMVAGGAVLVMQQLRDQSIGMLGPGVVATLTSLALGVWATWLPRHAPKGGRTVGPFTLLARGSLAAVVIAGAVGLAAVAGPLVSGVASVFPAIFLTSMVSLWWSQGEAVQGGAVGPMMLGASSVSAYALFAALTLPRWGMGLGSVVAWTLAVVVVTVPAYAWLRGRPMPAASPSDGQ